MTEYPDLQKEQRDKITRTYWKNIYLPLERLKEADVSMFDKRADYKHVLVLRDYDPNELDEIF
tara:strand:+ start:215 stop:403 length:189 start_codon:yes stop_codon:yes gene_type:complete